jgi:hypothetical protein
MHENLVLAGVLANESFKFASATTQAIPNPESSATWQ